MKRNKIDAYGLATGKVILMGEHAVVYGEPAIAIPFPATSIKVTITESIGPVQLNCLFHQGKLSVSPTKLASLQVAIDASLERLNQEKQDFAIQIASTIPPERGMGSSAAVAVATIRALFSYFHATLTDQLLLELTHLAETIAHGNPSGLDGAVTSGKNPLFYIKGQNFVPFALKLDAYLVVADTGIPGQTKEAVEGIANLMKEDPAPTKLAIEQLGQLAREAKAAIELNDVKHLGKSMFEAHQLLDLLGVSLPALNQLVEVARNHGAMGAKLTGGGRGGCMIALTANQTIAGEVANALLEAGAIDTWTYKMGEDIIG